MTEELKQKAEEYAINMWGNDEAFIDERNNCKQDYITGATEATKELQEENRQLKNIKDVADLLRLNNDTVITMCQLNNELVSANQRIADLEKQIEKMKRCEMCKNHNWQGCVFSSEKRLDCINNKRNLFELKE